MRVTLRTATSTAPDAVAAVTELSTQLGEDADLMLAFVPERYDWDEAATALTHWGGSRIVACTSAGGIGPEGYTRSGIVAVTLRGADVTVHTVPITPLSDLETAWALAAGRLSAAVEATGGRPAFAVLLVDGLSTAEEDLTDGLAGWLGDGIPLVGGSAGDDLHFRRAGVLVGGRFLPDAATVSIVTTSAPFRPIRVQHHVAGVDLLVVTDATPAERLVHTFNGRPAAAEYAAAVGTDVDRLGPDVFSAHPLILRSGGAEWVRSISQVEPDGSTLRFLSAADRGHVLRVARSMPPLATLETAFQRVTEDLGKLDAALVFDCILRRLEFEAGGLDTPVGSLLARHHATGFSTFGEQYRGVHVNQTLVGLAFGG